MKKYCYILENDYNHSGDPGVDAFCVKFEGDSVLSGMIGTRNLELPEVLYFTADFGSIPQYDYPLTDITAPVMSKRMLDVFKGISDFKHLSVPVMMLDYNYLDDQFDKAGNLKSDVPVNKDYMAVQLKEYTKAFDYENSKYEMDLAFPEDVGTIEKLVLKEPESGFPPLFRLEESKRHLIVNQEAREALEKNGIVGCVFEPVEVSG